MANDVAAVINGSARWALVHGDGFAHAAELPDAIYDHTITDPPYDEKTHRGARAGGDGSVVLDIDFAPLTSYSFVPHLAHVARRWAIAFCSMEQLGDYKRAAGEVWVRSGFWFRPDGMPQMTGDRPAQPGEALAIMHRKGRKRWNNHGHKAYWSHGIERGDRVHPTQKPLSLMIELIEAFTDPDDVIFDPCSGGATTGLACLRTGRRFVGFEIDPKHYAEGLQRMRGGEIGLTVKDMRAGQLSIFGRAS